MRKLQEEKTKGEYRPVQRHCIVACCERLRLDGLSYMLEHDSLTNAVGHACRRLKEEWVFSSDGGLASILLIGIVAFVTEPSATRSFLHPRID
jgi:hypothetical protein